MSRKGQIPGTDGFISPPVFYQKCPTEEWTRGWMGSISFYRSPLFSRHVNNCSLYSHLKSCKPAFTTVYSVLIPHFCEVGTLHHNSFSNTEEEAEAFEVEVTSLAHRKVRDRFLGSLTEVQPTSHLWIYLRPITVSFTVVSGPAKV